MNTLSSYKNVFVTPNILYHSDLKDQFNKCLFFNVKNVIIKASFFIFQTIFTNDNLQRLAFLVVGDLLVDEVAVLVLVRQVEQEQLLDGEIVRKCLRIECQHLSSHHLENRVYQPRYLRTELKFRFASLNNLSEVLPQINTIHIEGSAKEKKKVEN